MLNHKNMTTMKKLYSIITTTIICISSMFTLTSCEDDAQMVAHTLEGSWTGYIDTYIYDRWGVSGSEYRVTFTFIRNSGSKYDYDSSTSGRGIEMGYNVNDRYANYYRSTFSWYVDDDYYSYHKPTIIITYDDDWYHPIYIYDYRISGNRFYGYMDDGTNREIQFDLYYDDGFDYYSDRWYSRTRSGDGTDESVKVIDNGKSIRSGIFAEIEPK